MHKRGMMTANHRRQVAPLAVAVILLAGLLLLAAGCARDRGLQHDEERGLYTAELEEMTGAEADTLLAQGATFEEQGDYPTALLRYQELVIRFPGDTLQAFEARRRIVRCYIRQEQYLMAHEAILTLVAQYKEYIQRTENIDLWEQVRDTWYHRIALSLFYADRTTGTLREDLDDAILVFERILDEEPHGRYSAKCLLRIGDSHYAQEDWEEACQAYLTVVGDYSDFRSDYEEAIYKAAYATFATLKGADYDLDVIENPGSELRERGALDLCRSYNREFPAGRFRGETEALEDQIYDLLAYRLFEAGRTYERLGYDTSAYYQYQLVIDTYGDMDRYPNQQEWVAQAREARDDLPHPGEDAPPNAPAAPRSPGEEN